MNRKPRMSRAGIGGWLFTAPALLTAVASNAGKPTHMRKEFASGDGLHPGGSGLRAIGDTIDLSIFP